MNPEPPALFCRRCSRPLTHPLSRLLGIGPECRRALEEEAREAAEVTHNPFIAEHPFARDGLVVRRLADGRLACNIAQRHVYHSPTGFEIGYAGSGPLDMGLNVLALLLPGHEIAVGKTRISQAAWDLHLAFTHAFIAPLNRYARAPQTIALEAMTAWLERCLTTA